jgi:tRNA (adenine57-N1/adenine58-N1)-methyltransferase
MAEGARTEGVGPLVAGELVLLWERPGRSTIVPLLAAPQTIEGLGVLDLSPVVGQAVGCRFDWAGRPCRVIRPSLADRLSHLRRRAQIITPKDAASLLFLAGVSPGGIVLEAGAGSGAMTVALAHAVGPTGRVVAFDRREEFLAVARENVRRAGYADRVEFRLRDVGAEGFGTEGAGSLVLDVPEPWSVFAHAARALGPGASLGVYTPTYNQLERSVRELRSAGFEEIRSLELLERALHVGEGGTRPEFDMLGHTGFLTGARWMGPPW